MSCWVLRSATIQYSMKHMNSCLITTYIRTVWLLYFENERDFHKKNNCPSTTISEDMQYILCTCFNLTSLIGLELFSNIQSCLPLAVYSFRYLKEMLLDAVDESEIPLWIICFLHLKLTCSEVTELFQVLWWTCAICVHFIVKGSNSPAESNYWGISPAKQIQQTLARSLILWRNLTRTRCL